MGPERGRGRSRREDRDGERACTDARDGQAGSVAALPIWANFMKAVYDTLDWPDVPFERAENVVELEICSVTGKNPTPYCPIKTEIYNKKYVPEGICPIHTGAIDKKKGKIDF